MWTQRIISPMQSSSMAAPMVPVLKKNGKIQLCGDSKLTINQASSAETHPLPRIDELYANLSGGNFSQSWTKVSFSKIAYHLESHLLLHFFNNAWRCC